MIPEDTDFISNIANTLSLHVLDKLKKAKEYFREDQECVTKCVMMQHMAVINILCDYVMLMQDISPLPSKELFAMIEEDTFKLIKKQKEYHERESKESP